MDFMDIVKTVGAGILSAVPGGAAVLGVVNAILPDDEKLPANATATQVGDAVSRLPLDKQAEIMSKQFDVEIAEINAWEKIQSSLSQADATGSSTRPYIAKMMAWLVTIVVTLFISVWVRAIFNEDDETLKILADSWPMMLAVIGTPTALLRSYFGMRTKEKTARYSAASGQPNGLVANLIGAFRK